MKKTLLITGASGNIGTAVCHYLAKQGNHLILTARNETKLAALTNELQQYDKNIQYVCSDFFQHLKLCPFAQTSR